MKYILTVFIVLSVGMTFAQKGDSTTISVEQLSKQITGLNKEIKAKDKTISQLEAEVQRLEMALHVSDSLLRYEKEQSKAALLRKQIVGLQQDTARLSALLKSETEELEQKYEKKLTDARTTHLKDYKTIDSLKNELKGLNEFKKVMFSQMVAAVNDNWLNKPLAEIDSVSLVNDLNRYEKFREEDKGIKDAYNKLQKQYSDYLIYRKAIIALNSVYNFVVVNELRNNVSGIRKTARLELDKDDLKTLYDKLDNYKVTVEIFQEIIAAIDKKINDEKEQKSRANKEPNKIGLTASIMAYIDIQESDYKYISAINEIPYLRRIFAEYTNALKTDCFSKKVEEISSKIKSINTEK